MASEASPSTSRAKRKWGCSIALALGLLALPTLGTVEYVSGDPRRAQNESFKQASPDERLDVFVLGDSVSAGEMAYSDTLTTLRRTRSPHERGWALDLHSPGDHPHSVFETLSAEHPIRIENAAWSGAYVDKASPLDRTAANIMGSIRNFSDQASALRKKIQQAPPNLILIAPFHNNLDWAYDLNAVASLNGDKAAYLERIPGDIAKTYEAELLSLIGSLRTSTHRPQSSSKVSIVVYGYMNLHDLVEARRESSAQHQADATKFPHFAVALERFPSVRTENQADTLLLAEAVNTELRASIDRLAQQLEKDGDNQWLQLRFSTAFAEAVLRSPQMLHHDDAFHPSAKGHSAIAKSVLSDLDQSLRFLLPERTK